MIPREVKGTCSVCGRTIVRRSPISLKITCDCYKYCPHDHGQGAYRHPMTPYLPELNPRIYRDEKNIDPLARADKDEASASTLYVCYNHVPPHYSRQMPTEVLLE